MALISRSLISVRAEVKDCWRVMFWVTDDSRSTRRAQDAPPTAMARSTYASAVLPSACAGKEGATEQRRGERVVPPYLCQHDCVRGRGEGAIGA